MGKNYININIASAWAENRFSEIELDYYDIKVEGGKVWGKANPEAMWVEVDVEEVLGEAMKAMDWAHEMYYAIQGLWSDIEDIEDGYERELRDVERERDALAEEVEMLRGKLEEVV